MTGPQRLFVYGSLQPGGANEHVLCDVVGQWQGASVAGHLRQEGWGAELGYPGLVLAGDGQRVEGFVLSSSRLAEHWAALDQFEGEQYERRVASVRLDSGLSVDAFVYVLREG